MNTGRPRQRHPYRGCSAAAMTGVFWALIGVDVVLVFLNDAPRWGLVAPLAAGAAAAPPIPKWRTQSTTWRVGAGGGASALITLLTIVAPIDHHALFGPGEVAALMWLIVIAVRTLPAMRAVLIGSVAAASLTALPLRLSPLSDTQPAGPALLGLLGIVAMLVAMRLRSSDQSHQLELVAARRSERLAMAADLHDYVGHHLVELLLQVQMGRMQLAAGQCGGDEVLASTEQAAVDALDAVRRAVGTLRGNDDEMLTTAPPTMSQSTLQEVVESFRRTHRGTAMLDQKVDVGGLPPDVQAALHRVLTESLTNAHRHASPDSTVDIVVENRSGAVGLSVRNDGIGRPLSAAASSGGRVGLLSLDERIRSLNGSFAAGPVDDDTWLVDVTLPLPAKAGRTL